MNGFVKRGAFIAVEGCDRSGKSTQCKLLCDSLKNANFPCHLLRFPDRSTVIGQVIDRYLQQNRVLEDHVIHLLFSANRWEKVQEIKNGLMKGQTVIVDRYAYSGASFSSAKQGMDLAWCCQPDVGLPCPDLVIFLDILPEKAAQRAEYGTEIYENLEFQTKVYNNFKKLMDSNWQIVDADRSPEAVHQDLFKKAVQGIHTANHKPVQELWNTLNV